MSGQVSPSNVLCQIPVAHDLKRFGVSPSISWICAGGPETACRNAASGAESSCRERN